MTQSQPKVSVISTVYNGEPYFNQSIPSILGQKYGNFEYIIIDDGSIDGTQEYLRKLAQQDSRVRVFFPGRLGRAKALNYAVEQAKGDYIANQDFDDTSHPERLRLQANFLDTYPEVGLVGGAYIHVDDNRREKYIRTPATDHHQLIKTMAQCVPFAHTVTTFRREAWQQVGGYPLVDNLIDLRFWLKIAGYGWKLGSVSDVIGEHWVHPNSFWHQNFKYQQRQQDLAEVQWQAIRQFNLPLWYGTYPFGRYFYAYLPTDLKRWIRCKLLGIKEENLTKVANS